MATVRLMVVVLILGLVVLLGVQNLAPALPLVFLGGSTPALGLGLWLVGAVGLGALTTLVLTALLGSVGGSAERRSNAYKYRPQSFYEPAGSTADTAAQAARNTPPPYTQPGSGRAGSGRTPASPSTGAQRDDTADDDPSWRAWTNLRSPGQWQDWEALSRAPKPETELGSSPAANLVDGVTTWFSSSKQRAKQQQRVSESMRELDDDWGGLENQPYRAPGVSPVEDSLDEIAQGWGEGSGASDPLRGPDRDRNFEAAQAPRRVYRDGSIYSYSYRDEGDGASGGQVDNIYAPPDESYGDEGLYGDDYPGPRYSTDDYESESDYGSDYPPGQVVYDDEGDYGGPELASAPPLGEPEMAEDGVVDADYRVIIPPYTAAAEAAASSVERWTDGEDDSEPDADRPRDGGSRDEWDDADDALTP